jgi:hypothetical protein
MFVQEPQFRTLDALGYIKLVAGQTWAQLREGVVIVQLIWLRGVYKP